MKVRASLLSVFLVLLVGPLPQAASASEVSPAAMRKHVEFLAADRMAGREAGCEQIAEAEEYIASRFEALGLEPLPGRDGYYVDFDLYRDGAGIAELAFDRDGSPYVGLTGEAVRSFEFSGEGLRTAPVVFAGYGITAPEHDHDDYEDLDVEGKLVLVLRHEPGENDTESPFAGTDTTSHALFSTKADNAREHGAVGMILVTDPLNHGPGDDLRVGGRLSLERPDPTSDASDEPFLAVQIAQELAGALVGGSRETLEQLQAAVDDGKRPSELASVVAGVTAEVTVEVRRGGKSEKVRARNVIGILPGSDPGLSREWILIGGHHDHIGGYDATGDSVFNGADDNASGVAGVLELARQFAGGDRPKRSLVFATFSAEEKGLLGSRALVDQRLIDLDRVVFMMNLDMIGRNPNQPIDVFGDGFVGGLREVVEAANRPLNLDLEFGGRRYEGNSDHDSFYRVDIPFMFFFTGTHPDYHQLGDHADKLDYARMGRIVELAAGVVTRLAGAPGAPGFLHNIGWLGVRVEVVAHDGEPVAAITAVDAGSRAAAAGLQVGDLLQAFDDAPVDDPQRIGEAFRSIEPGSEATLAIRRNGESLRIEVARARVGYMGVQTGAVDEDLRDRLGLAPGEGVLISRVVADGPSDRGGLESGDVLIRINGRPVGRDTLIPRLSQIGAGETVEVTVIRDDARVERTVTLGERPSR